VSPAKERPTSPRVVHVVSACSIGWQGPASAARLRLDVGELARLDELLELSRAGLLDSSSAEELVALLAPAAAWGFDSSTGQALERAGMGAKNLSAFVEVDTLLALLERDKADAGVLHLLVDFADARHAVTRELIERWIANRPKASVPLRLDVVDVAIETASGRVSVLNSEATVTSSPLELAAAEHKLIEVASDLLSRSTRTEPFFVNARSGSSLAKQALGQALNLGIAKRDGNRLGAVLLQTREDAGEWATPEGVLTPARTVLDASGTPLVPFAVPMSVSTSIMHQLFDQAVRVVNDGTIDDDERRERIRNWNLAGQVIYDGEDWRLTSSAWAMIDAFPFVEGPSYSACAGLLVRHPSAEAQELGARLRDHVLRWHVTGLFRKNLVPEIVLHDEPHTQAVDRHAAALLAPALAAGKVDPGDVYLVALACWLHDWGHASGGTVGDAPTSGADVRDLHGLLSGRRIDDKQHLLGQQLGLNAEEKIWTSLLAKHHQSWTSCDGRPPSAERGERRVAERFRVPVASFRVDVDLAKRNLAQLDARLAPITPERAQALLAVLRVADGADLGVHRTPHMLAPVSISTDAWSAVYSQAIGAMRALDGTTDGPLARDLRIAFEDEEVAGFFRQKRPELRGLGEDALNTEVATIVRASFGDNLPVELQQAGNSSAHDIVEQLLRTLRHLLKQQHHYYPQHASVSGVHLVPHRREKGRLVFRVLVHVRPDLHLDPELAHLNEQQILDVVGHDVLKEVGLRGKDPDWRAPLRTALGSIGIALDDGEDGVQILPRPVDDQGMSLPAKAAM